MPQSDLILFAKWVLTEIEPEPEPDLEPEPTPPLRVGMDLRWPPFETEANAGTPLGISVDVAYALGKFLGRDVEIVNISFASLIPSLQSGEIDIIIASMSNTPARAETINFSDIYFYFKTPSFNSMVFSLKNVTSSRSSLRKI